MGHEESADARPAGPVSAATALATAVVFTWLGMVLAISFLEAPLKFRAPGVDLRTGLGIGRLVFRGLNTAEAALAVALIVAVGSGNAPAQAVTVAVVAVLVLAVQLALVRPRLNKRSDVVLAGGQAPRSHSHLAYVGLEVAKVAALVVAGALLMT